MAASDIGRVKSSRGKVYKVKWDAKTKYVYANGTNIGKAYSAADAMRKAEAYVYNR